MANLPHVIEAYIAAYNRKDIERMLACLSDEVSFRNISDGEATAEASDKPSFEAMSKFGVSAFRSRHQKVTNAITVADTTLTYAYLPFVRMT